MKVTRVGLVGLSFAMIASVAVGFATHGPVKTTVAGVGWYADLSQALSEAKRTNKPVLLLSMFGKLDEEMPCANARTLRATLFKDPEFKKFITSDVVPAWEMVRAVPKIQFDLGDGKKITRTVRGNAVLYLCRPDGKVVDAYPGIYTAADFMPMVREAVSKLALADDATVLAFHKERAAMVGGGAMTAGKAVVESPTLDLIGAKKIRGTVTSVQSTDPERAKFLTAAARLRDLSLTPMSPEEAVMATTGHPADGRSPKELASDILSSDSANNMRMVRPVIHLWLASEKVLPTTLQARDTVLETILKIPYKDPYFGLRDVLLPGTSD